MRSRTITYSKSFSPAIGSKNGCCVRPWCESLRRSGDRRDRKPKAYHGDTETRRNRIARVCEHPYPGIAIISWSGRSELHRVDAEPRTGRAADVGSFDV